MFSALSAQNLLPILASARVSRWLELFFTRLGDYSWYHFFPLCVLNLLVQLLFKSALYFFSYLNFCYHSVREGFKLTADSGIWHGLEFLFIKLRLGYWHRFVPLHVLNLLVQLLFKSARYSFSYLSFCYHLVGEAFELTVNSGIWHGLEFLFITLSLYYSHHFFPLCVLNLLVQLLFKSALYFFSYLSFCYHSVAEALKLTANSGIWHGLEFLFVTLGLCYWHHFFLSTCWTCWYNCCSNLPCIFFTYFSSCYHLVGEAFKLIANSGIWHGLEFLFIKLGLYYWYRLPPLFMLNLLVQLLFKSALYFFSYLSFCYHSLTSLPQILASAVGYCELQINTLLL